MTDQFFKLLDEHREELNIPHKGYITKLQSLFKDQYNIDRSKSWIKAKLSSYRVLKNCPLQYREDKYYNSERKKQRLINYT